MLKLLMSGRSICEGGKEMKLPGMHTGFRDDGTWRNWAGNQVAHPVRIERPRSEEEVVGLVRSAAAEGRKVRVVGAGHSFSAIAVTDEVLVTLDDFASVVSLDRDSGLARVEAGMRLFNLNPLLDVAGLAMPNLGDIAYQSVAGAIATSTHGTGLGFQSIAAGVVGLRMVTADGSVLVCDEQQNPEMLQVARVGLGALGIVTEVTLQCVPAFNLQAREEVMNIDDLLSNFDEFAENTDHTEFFWMPHTKNALLKRNTRTQEEPPPPRNRRHAARRKWKHFKNKELLENVAFGAMNHLGRLRPSLVPRFNAMMVPDEGSANYITTSYEVFASPRRVHFYEMEYAVARQDGLEAFRQVQALIDTLDHPVSFPLEVRVLGADDISLSTASGRDTIYIAVHMFHGTEYEQYFRGVEAIMNQFEGRPHWGKLHYQTAETLAGRYPRWGEFQALRSRLDPSGMFTNEEITKVLGPVG